MKAFALCLTILFGTAFAAETKCPQNSVGVYPKCKCTNGAVYAALYNWCQTSLNDFDGQCPENAPGIFPNCDCGLGKSFDTTTNECSSVNRGTCPKGAAGVAPNCKCDEGYAFDEVHWYCRPWYLSTTHKPVTYRSIPIKPSCAALQYGTYPDCHWRPCPSHALNPEAFEPHCRYNVTYVEYKPCPAGLVGSPPDCYKPCPAYHYGRQPHCERIRCQTGPGWSGEFAPDCKHTPTCPPSHPGVWPYCDIYKATTQKNEYLPPVTRSIPTTTTTTTKIPSTYLPPVPRSLPTTTTTTTTTKIPSTYLPPVPRSIPTTTTTTTQSPNTYLPPLAKFSKTVKGLFV